MNNLEKEIVKAIAEVKAREPKEEDYELHPDGYRIGYFEDRLEWLRESCTRLQTLHNLKLTEPNEGEE